MPIRNLFKWQRMEHSAYEHDNLRHEFKVQVVNIWERLFSKVLIMSQPTSARVGSLPEFFSDEILKKVGEEHGEIFNAHFGHNDFACLANYFLRLKNPEKILQVIQIAFGFAEEQMRPWAQQYRQLGCQDIDEAIADLNYRFQQHSIGYQYLHGQIVVIDEQYQKQPATTIAPGVKIMKNTDKQTKPRLFIGSSVEGLEIAEKIQEGLDHSVECTIWSQGVFGLSQGTLDSIVAATKKFDCAVLVLTPDDLTIKRRDTKNSPRDNVLFELGLFMGALGRERTYIVYCRDEQLDLPTDLAGVTAAKFGKRSDGNLRAALGPVCSSLKDAIKAAMAET